MCIDLSLLQNAYRTVPVHNVHNTFLYRTYFQIATLAMNSKYVRHLKFVETLIRQEAEEGQAEGVEGKSEVMDSMVDLETEDD